MFNGWNWSAPKYEKKNDKNSHVTMLLFSITFEVWKKWCELRFTLFEWNDQKSVFRKLNEDSFAVCSFSFLFFYCNGMWIVCSDATIDSAKKATTICQASIHCLLFEMCVRVNIHYIIVKAERVHLLLWIEDHNRIT